MEPENHDVHGPEVPEVEPTLLLRYLVKKYDELLESDHPGIPISLGGLSLSGVAHDQESEAELQHILYPAIHPDKTLLTRCRDIFLRTLARTKEGQESPRHSVDDRGLPSLDEGISREMVISTLHEGRKMIAAEDYEFAQVIRVLGWIALQRVDPIPGSGLVQ